MTAIKIFLFSFVWMMFFLLKGIMFRTRMVKILLFFLTFSFFLLALYIAKDFLTPLIKYTILIYLLVSYTEYLLVTIKRIPFPIWPLFSGVSITCKQFVIRYQLFRPFILLPINIILFFKTKNIIHLFEYILLDIFLEKKRLRINLKI